MPSVLLLISPISRINSFAIIIPATNFGRIAQIRNSQNLLPVKITY